MLAHVMSPGRGETDRLLELLAERLIRDGVRVGGVVQTNTERAAPHLCDMDVRVLPDGQAYRISQTLGVESRSCRLDPAALEQAVGEVESRLNRDTQLLLINKFGKHEADGRGFRPVIGEAVVLGIPVLTGVNEKNFEAWMEFSDGNSVGLAAELDALCDWARAAVAG